MITVEPDWLHECRLMLIFIREPVKLLHPLRQVASTTRQSQFSLSGCDRQTPPPPSSPLPHPTRRLLITSPSGPVSGSSVRNLCVTFGLTVLVFRSHLFPGSILKKLLHTGNSFKVSAFHHPCSFAKSSWEKIEPKPATLLCFTICDDMPPPLVQIRCEGIRLFLLWLQALRDNCAEEQFLIFACLVPGFPAVPSSRGPCTLDTIIYNPFSTPSDGTWCLIRPTL